MKPGECPTVPLDRLWRDGGGRDGTPAELRTPTQRRCDALCHHNIHDRGYIVIKTDTGYKIINPNNPPPDYSDP